MQGASYFNVLPSEALGSFLVVIAGVVRQVVKVYFLSGLTVQPPTSTFARRNQTIKLTNQNLSGPWGPSFAPLHSAPNASYERPISASNPLKHRD